MSGGGVPKYRFKWTNLPEQMLRGVCRDLGLDGDPAETLHVAYGARPSDNFVRDAWPSLRDRWLAKDGEARRFVVGELWQRGIGDEEQPGNREAEIAFLRSRNNARGLRQVVLSALIAWGERDASESQPSQQAPPKDPTQPERPDHSSPDRFIWHEGDIKIVHHSPQPESVAPKPGEKVGRVRAPLESVGVAPF